MLDEENTVAIEDKINEFTESMLLKRNFEANRTWMYRLERFFDYVLQVHNTIYPNFTAKTVNDYIEHLASLDKSSTYIQQNVDIIIMFSQFLNRDIDKEILNIPTVAVESPNIIDEEKDLYHTENCLFERTKEHTKYITLNDNEPTIEEIALNPYDKVRDYFRDYLMFRLIIESGFDVTTIIRLDLADVSNDGSIIIDNREVPIKEKTLSILKEYLLFRKKFDHSIYIQKVMQDLISGEKKIDQLFVEMKDFFELDLQEKLNKIEYLLINQVKLEEEIQHLEEIDNVENERKIEALEDQVDNIVEKMNDMKMIIVFERKINEYKFNSAMFVSDSYNRLDKSSIMEVMKKEAFPVDMLQNTAIKKWKDSGMKQGLIDKILGRKAEGLFTRSNGDIEKDAVQKIVNGGFSFEERKFFA